MIVTILTRHTIVDPRIITHLTACDVIQWWALPSPRWVELACLFSHIHPDFSGAKRRHSSSHAGRTPFSRSLSRSSSSFFFSSYQKTDLIPYTNYNYLS